MSSTKYIFVTGGVTSSLGKGIISASLAKLLQARGYKVTIQKLDPYLNVDPGTLNPYEHGECYITDDGAETDLDLGHYERFLNVPTSQANNITTGRIYQSVINKERRGEYMGKTVQIIPHITDEIKRSIRMLGTRTRFDFVITEIGGTVGDIESLPYIETVRQLKWEYKDKCLVIHLTLVPYLAATGELKTKPTQHSVKMLQEAGVQPDIIVLRSEHPLNEEIKRKVALFCNVAKDSVIESKNVKTIYEVPLLMRKEKLDAIVLKKFNMPVGSPPELLPWQDFLTKLKKPKHVVNLGLIGKYVELKDAYKSISESFVHAGVANDTKVIVHYIQSEEIDNQTVEEKLANLDGILVAPGFGHRGINGKIEAVKYARENNIPFLGISLGMQLAVVEFARNVLGWKDANSIELNPETKHPVIDLMEKQKMSSTEGSTMRLGACPCKISKDSNAYKAYKKLKIIERHRHRFEFNTAYYKTFEKAGMKATGINPDNQLIEIIEIPEHKWFVGVQFHPEYKSTVLKPHPLFVEFVKAMVSKK
ncbi:MAG: CTP synthase [Bacteroidales bacterium]|nr:CTP synthase [Bacteroidales bacterium]